MNNPNSPSDPSTPRATLKLKVGARKSAPAPIEKPVAQESRQPPRNKADQKPGARWSDEYKERMQADMDALTSR